MLQTDLSISYLERNSKGEEKKLMLLLHGFGSNEADLFSFAADLPEDLKVISCQAPYASQFGGYAWYDIQLMDGKKLVNFQEAKKSLDLLALFIDELIAKYNIDPQEVSLLGFSQGAILSNLLALHHPTKVQNIVMLSGYHEEELEPLNTDQEYSNLNYFISHGIEDTVIPVEWAEKTPLKLKELNINHKFTTYNSGHGINPQNYHDMMQWIADNV